MCIYKYLLLNNIYVKVKYFENSSRFLKVLLLLDWIMFLFKILVKKVVMKDLGCFIFFRKKF